MGASAFFISVRAIISLLVLSNLLVYQLATLATLHSLHAKPSDLTNAPYAWVDNLRANAPNFLGESETASKCATEGSFAPPSKIVIDYEKVRKMDKTPLQRVKHLTEENAEEYIMAEAGKDHYALLNYISATYGDCRHFADIGTRYAASALAAGSNLKTPVWTFDTIGGKQQLPRIFRGRSEENWKALVQNAGVNITFHNLDLLKVPAEELRTYLGTWFVMLDTLHEPDSNPFEREFFQRMVSVGFKGVLLLDDIHLNSEMEKWWKELQDGAEKGGYKTYDVTEIGHFSGTGLVDFSGQVSISIYSSKRKRNFSLS